MTQLRQILFNRETHAVEALTDEGTEIIGSGHLRMHDNQNSGCIHAEIRIGPDVFKEGTVLIRFQGNVFDRDGDARGSIEMLA